MTDTQKIILGADHGGWELRKIVAKHLREKRQWDVEEVGSDGETQQYPDVAKAVCSRVSSGEYGRAILFCGSGIGISIAANKINGIRCALCHDHYTALMSKQHNDANVIALGGRTTGSEIALDIVDTWLDANFVGLHHVQRVQLIHDLEGNTGCQ